MSGSGDQQLLPVSQTGAPAPARPAATVLPRVGICATMFSDINSWFTPLRERLGLAAPLRCAASPPPCMYTAEYIYAGVTVPSAVPSSARMERSSGAA